MWRYVNSWALGLGASFWSCFPNCFLEGLKGGNCVIVEPREAVVHRWHISYFICSWRRRKRWIFLTNVFGVISPPSDEIKMKFCQGRESRRRGMKRPWRMCVYQWVEVAFNLQPKGQGLDSSSVSPDHVTERSICVVMKPGEKKSLTLSLILEMFH